MFRKLLDSFCLLFHDAHCHPFGAGNRLRQQSSDSVEDDLMRASAIDISSCSTWTEVEQALKVASGQDGTSAIFAEGGKPELFHKASVRASDLEKLAMGRSIVVTGENQVIASDTALRELPKLCKFWRYAKEDPNIERNEEGEPTGRFCGFIWVTRFSLLSQASMASKGLRGLRRGLSELPKHGIVSCTDAFVFEDRVPMYELIASTNEACELPRVSLAIGFKSHLDEQEIGALINRVKPLLLEWSETSHRLCVREAKVEIDNVGRWSSSVPCSRPNWDLVQLDRVIQSMVAAGFSMHCHVFGDLAAKHAIASIRRAEEAMPEKRQLRHKLAHVFELQREDEVLLCSKEVEQCYFSLTGSQTKPGQATRKTQFNSISDLLLQEVLVTVAIGTSPCFLLWKESKPQCCVLEL